MVRHLRVPRGSEAVRKQSGSSVELNTDGMVT